MKYKVVLITFSLCFVACFSFGQDSEKLVQITTEYGIIKVKLYNETPIHRDNFIKLVNDKTYNGTFFIG